MTQKRQLELSPQTLRLFLFGWFGISVITAGCVFGGILLFAGNRAAGKPGQVAGQTTPVVRTVQPNVIPPGGVTPTVPAGAAVPTTSSGSPGQVQDNGIFALGGQLQPYREMPHKDQIISAGMTWVKFQVVWQPGVKSREARDLVIFAKQEGFKVLLSIKGPLNPTSIEYQKYINYLRQIAEDTTKVDAIEIWNEMNLDREWPSGQIDPASYVNNMLKPAYETIKAASPNTMVIIGALAPTGADDGVKVWSDDRYVKGLAAAGAAQYADCIGVHHNSGTTPPDATTGHAWDNGDHHYSWYFKPTIDVYYNGMGGKLPVCFTEYGYLSPEGYGPLPENFAWAAKTTVAQQSQWLAQGVTIARSLGYVRLMIVWNVDFTEYGDDPKAGYAIIRADGSCPACETLKAAVMAP